MGEIVTRNI